MYIYLFIETFWSFLFLEAIFVTKTFFFYLKIFLYIYIYIYDVRKILITTNKDLM